MRCAGGNSLMPLKAVRGAIGAQSVKIWSSAIGSISAPMPGTCQQRLHFGGEEQHALVRGVEQRTDAHPVARQHHLLPLLVPDREGEIAIEPVDAIGPHLVIKLKNDFGVGAGAEAPALGHQLVAQFDIVEDLAVEADPHRAVLYWPSAAGRRKARRSTAVYARGPHPCRREYRSRPVRDGRSPHSCG